MLLGALCALRLDGRPTHLLAPYRGSETDAVGIARALIIGVKPVNTAAEPFKCRT